MWRLVPLQEGLEPLCLPEAAAVTVGRKTTCTLVIGESFAYVSGEHCRISTSEVGGVCLEDLSGNGTYINGGKVGKGNTSALQVGDEISLAKPTRKGGALKFKIEVAQQRRDLGHAPAAAIEVTKQGPPASPAPENERLPEPGVTRCEAAAAVPAVPAVLFDGAEGWGDAATKVGAATPVALHPVSSVVHQATGPAPPVALQAAGPLPSVALPSVGGCRAPSPALGAPAIGGAFAGSLNRERQQEELELAWIRSRQEEEAARIAQLASELQELRMERDEQSRYGHGRPMLERRALSEGNVRMAEDCEELQARLVQLREEAVHIESAYPAAEESAARELRECTCLRAELDTERACAEQVEAEAAELKAKAEASTGHIVSLREEVALAEARNAFLEEECAEAAGAVEEARITAQQTRSRLEGRSEALSSLRQAVRDHARKVGDRISLLEESLMEVPSPSGESQAALAATEAIAPMVDGQHPSFSSRTGSGALPADAFAGAGGLPGGDLGAQRCRASASTCKGSVGRHSLDETPTQAADAVAGQKPLSGVVGGGHAAIEPFSGVEPCSKRRRPCPNGGHKV